MSQAAQCEQRDSAVIRFAGDSGDGIQVTGGQFTNESALAGNDIATLPNFPAEIRAPAGTLAGVSAFQINFGNFEIYTPGDTPDVLVAMNPAALRANLADLKPGGVLILNEDAFDKKNLARVDYESNPCEDQELAEKYRLYVVPITRLTKDALAETDLGNKAVERCKNFFTLGIMLWMFNRGPESTERWLKAKFKKKPEIADANILALKGGMAYAEATEIFDITWEIPPASMEPGTYRNIDGTMATAYGLIAAAQKSELPMFFGAYPITPASDLLHELAKHKGLGITTFQAEDEIAAVGATIGAAYAGSLAITSSSGPGVALKIEAIDLALIAELPMVIIDVQRGGPSTGLPTKTEQSDLFLAAHGRPGDAPLCVLAASSPESAFEMAYEAARIATKYTCPVILLTDGYIANSSQPWRIPDPSQLKPFEINKITENNNPDGEFLPYKRDEKTLARPWAVPGIPGLTHRIGGLEKEHETGNVSYDSDNHHLMTTLRAEKIERIAQDIDPIEVQGDKDADLLVVGWGGTEGTLRQAVESCIDEGVSVARIHLKHICPFAPNLGEILTSYKRILLPEINTGQMKQMLQGEFLVEIDGLNVVRGEPLKVSQVVEEIKARAGSGKGSQGAKSIH